MIRTSIRSLWKTPLFTLLVVATLALGIGANTAVFSVWKAIAFNPLPYGDPEQLVTIAETDGRTAKAESAADATIYQFQVRSGLMERMSMWGDHALWPLKQGHADLLRGMSVSPDFFDTLGVKMLLGHTFTKEDDSDDKNDKLILSYSLWMSYFGGDRNVLGRVFPTRSDDSFTVIGILPADFHPLHMSNPGEIPQFYIRGGMSLSDRFCFSCRGRVIGKLKKGATVAQARAELSGIMRQLVRENPNEYAEDAGIVVLPLQENLVGRFDGAMTMAFGSAGLLLLLACSNVANLMLARATGRRAEWAVRAALGAGRGVLVRQILTESWLLSLAGGVVGVAAAYVVTRLIAGAGANEIPRIDETSPNLWLLVWGFVVSLVTGLLFGIVPAMEAGRMDLRGLLAGATTASLGRTKHRFLHILVAVEIAVVFVLVLGVGLLGKSYWRLMSVNLGYDPRNVMTLTLFPHEDTAEKTIALYDSVVAHMRAISGVTEAGYASTLPLSNRQTSRIFVRGRLPAAGVEAPEIASYFVSQGYLLAMKIELVRGRLFDERDRRGGTAVALVSESCARRQFGDRDALGQQVKLGGDEQPWATVVGIVRDVHQYGLDRAADPAVYLPFHQLAKPQGWARLVVKSSVAADAIAEPVRRALRATDANLPVFHMQPMDAYIAKSVAQRSFALAMIGVFGALALLLATVGIYGVVAYTVGLRTKEVGIRMAVGADQGDVYRLILRDVLVMAGTGLAGGLVVAVWAGRLMESLLFGVTATDGATIGAVAALIGTVALLAGFLPARRAAGIEPVRALRDS